MCKKQLIIFLPYSCCTLILSGIDKILSSGVHVKFSIKHKIFFTLLVTSIVVALGLHTFLRWNFDRGFSKYIQNQELEQLDRLSERLIDQYKTHGSWQFIINNHQGWRRLHNDTASSKLIKKHPRPIKKGNIPPNPPPYQNPTDIGPRLVLFDVDKNWVIGAEGFPDSRENLELRPISDNDVTIGYLGLVSAKEFRYERDRHFVKDQTDAFAMIAIFMIALSLLLSYPVTMHLLRPIHALKKGTRELIAGKFKTRIPITTGDELGHLSTDFNSLATTLDKNEQSRRQWVADISHELRTPLTILRGEVEAIQDGIRKPEPDTIEALHGEIMHLERLVGDLYELSMSDAGALNYKRVKVYPVTILQNTIDSFSHRTGFNDLAINTDIESSTPFTILADPDRLQQLFVNILENSLRYTDYPGRIKSSLTVTNQNMVVTFEDSSPGVAPEKLPRIFNRFFRVEESRNRKSGGAGLGLAICKNIVEAHQGDITAESSHLGGILITITIPIMV